MASGVVATRAVAGPQTYSFTSLARLGDPAPGGGTFVNDFEPSEINDSGSVAFTADVSTGGEGAFIARNGTVVQLARSGLPAPGTGGNVFGPSEWGRIGLANNGDAPVPFFVGNFESTGVWRYSQAHGTLTPIAVHGTPTSIGVVDAAGANTFANNEGTMTFSATILGSDIDPSTPPGVDGEVMVAFSSARNGALTPIIAPGDPAPGGGIFDTSQNASVNNRGDFALGAHVAGEECVGIGPGSGVQCGESVYLKTKKGVVTSIAHQGDPAPGGGTFRLAFGALLNDSEQIAFVGDLTPAPNVGQVLGVYKWSHGVLTAVAKPGDPMPGGGHFVSTTFYDSNLGQNERGDISFAAQLDTDVNHDGIADTGIFVQTGNQLRVVARTGMNVPGFGTLTSIGDPNSFALLGGAMNNRGQVVFWATNGDGAHALLVASPQ